MTKLQKETKKAIIKWCEKQDIPIKSVRHIYSRAYVIARPATCCLIVACPPADQEPQIKKFHKNMYNDGTNTIHNFDNSLRIGDWCSVAYIVTKNYSRSIAIKCVEI